jgi:predicted TIM-barrel fold metal-dependent hydrolase
MLVKSKKPKSLVPVDWHTNLWLPRHLGSQWGEMSMKGTLNIDADIATHQSSVAAFCDRFVVCPIKSNILQMNIPNEYIAEYVQEYPEKAIGLAGADPHDDFAASDFERAIVKLGLKGLRLSPAYSGFDPWDANAWRLYEIANALDVPIFWQQQAAYPQQSFMEWSNPVLLDRIARSFPNLRMVLCHIGQPWYAETIMLIRKHPNVYADLSARYTRPWQCHNALMLAIDYKVTHKILFGSDFPVQTTKGAMNSFRAINRWGSDVQVPKVPGKVIEDILFNRPVSLLWPDLIEPIAPAGSAQHRV